MNVTIKNDNYHIPVMLKETVNFLEPWRGGNYIDCTLGGGGHSEEILLAMNGQGNLIGIDRDSEAIKRASKKLGNFQNFQAVKGAFGDIENIINSLDIKSSSKNNNNSDFQIEFPSRKSNRKFFELFKKGIESAK